MFDSGSLCHYKMELTALTVPQLRAICKEKCLTGYSKLGKSALLDKLSALSTKNTAHNSNAVQPPDLQNSSNQTSTSATQQTFSETSVLPVAQKAPTKPIVRKNDESNHRHAITAHIHTVGASAASPMNHLSSNTEANRQISPSRLPSGEANSNSTGISVDISETRIHELEKLGTKRVRVMDAGPEKTSSRPVEFGVTSSKRFKKILPDVTIPLSLTNSTTESCITADRQIGSSPNDSYLELDFFPSRCCGPLNIIAYPPSLAKRKSATAWSIILSQVKENDLLSCALACKALRYGGKILAFDFHKLNNGHIVFLSSIFILRSEFM